MLAIRIEPQPQPQPQPPVGRFARYAVSEVGEEALLEEIRRGSPETPVVLMTAQASLQSAIQAVNLGATHYVQKPFKNEEILAAVKELADE